MPPAPRPAPLDGSRRLRRAPLAVAVLGLLSLGGAVAGGYSTGLVLGTRIAPSGDALVAEPGSEDGPARPTPDGADPATGDDPGAEVTAPPPEGSVDGPPRPTPGASSTPPAGAPADPAPAPPTAPEPADPADPPAPEAPPSDPVAATERILGAAAGGDVDRVWDLLAPAVRAALGDRHALATRLTDLHDRLAPLRGGAPVAITTLATERGVVTVVAPVAPVGTAGLALPFVDVDGRPRLASIDPPAGLRWVPPGDGRTDLLVAGARRPVRVAVDGVEVQGTPAGRGGLRIAVTGLAEGSHQAVAVFVDGDQVTASSFEFAMVAPPPEGPVELPALAPDAASAAAATG